MIEAIEFRIYQQLNGAIENKKAFRQMNGERAAVLSKVDATLSQVEQLAELLDVSFDELSMERYRILLAGTTMDGYDLLHVESMRQHKISTILSDDRDYGALKNVLVIHDDLK